MDDPIEILMAEHRTIEGVLDALDAYTESLVERPDADRTDLARFVTVIQELADAEHHAKEEQILFVRMQRHGFSMEAGPIAVMLHEHDVGRGFVKTLAEIAGETSWPDDAPRRAREAARGFTSMLRMHIQKEDTILYPMAQRAMPPDAYADLAKAVAEHVAGAREDGRTDRLHGLAQELVEKYRA